MTRLDPGLTDYYQLIRFRCVQCEKQLVPGDKFALRNDGIYCKDDHNVDCQSEENNNNDDNTNKSDEANHEDEEDLDFEEEDIEKCDNGQSIL